MIVARLTDQLRNRQAKTAGSVRLQGYAHWFPLSSANFSLSGSDESDETAKAASAPTPVHGRQATTQQQPAPAAKKKKPTDTVSCSKMVDVASSALMYLSIFDKLKNRENENRETELMAADIHFLEVAGAGTGGASNTDLSDSNVVPYLKIALEGVTIDGWSFNGSDDTRPSETFNLKYEKIAMQYIQFDDKGKTMPVNAKGFSIPDLDNWIPNSWKGK